MADQSLDDYFAGPAMTKLMDAPLIKRGIPFFLPPELKTPSSQKPVGINVMYEEYKGVRTGGRMTNYNSPAVGVEVPGSDKKFITCLGGKESFRVPDELLMAVKSNIPYVAQNAMDEFLRRMKNFRTRAETRRTNMIAAAYLTGAVYYVPNNATGGTVALSSATAGAVNALGGYTPTTLAQGASLPTTGVGTGVTAVTVPDWSSAGTDIPGFIRQVKQKFQLYTGYEAAEISYGVNIPNYLGTSNTSNQTYWSRNQSYGSRFLDSNEIPSGAFDFSWHPAYKQYFIDENNNNTPTAWIGAKQIVVTPKIEGDWWEFVEGGTKAPIGGIPQVSSGSIEEQMGLVTYKWGINSYSQWDLNTLSLIAIMQDYCVALPKNGLVQWIINVA